MIDVRQHRFRDRHDSESCYNAAGYEEFGDPETVLRYVECREWCLAMPRTKTTGGTIHVDRYFSNIIIDSEFRLLR